MQAGCTKEALLARPATVCYLLQIFKLQYSLIDYSGYNIRPVKNEKKHFTKGEYLDMTYQ